VTRSNTAARSWPTQQTEDSADPMDRPAARLGKALRLLPAHVGGVLLAAAFGVTAVVRRTKPLHAIGGITQATWQVTRPADLGVPLLDSCSPQRVLVRVSRAASITRSGWDVMGLAVRVPGGAPDGHDADLLFATTGIGRWTRYLVLPQPAWGLGDYTTLLPLTWHDGTAVLRLQARSITHYDLFVSTRGRDLRRPTTWIPIGRLVLDSLPARDAPLRFHPVASPPVGFTIPTWIRALRRPAYVAARRLAPSASTATEQGS